MLGLAINLALVQANVAAVVEAHNTLGTNPGACVVEHCALQLAECEADRVCRTWSACTQGCGDDLTCQIRCGDLYKPTDATADKIVAFSECVISEHQCVPQVKQQCPLPHSLPTLQPFDLQSMVSGENNGSWYITRGWNELFDCFDCQHHQFVLNTSSVKPLQGALKYDVKVNLSCTENCSYLPREVFQSFSQVPNETYHLQNHNNTLAEMHYADDWYVLASSENFVAVYYCGCNDAECGYSGFFVYTNTDNFDALPHEDVEALRSAVTAAGIQNFTFDGLCAPSYASCSNYM